LRKNLAEHPDVRLVDRIEAWVQTGGKRIGLTAMCKAVHACGWTHKKRHRSPESATARMSKPSAKSSPKNSRS
jgi:hypothetical protein